jgi:HD domain
VTTPTLELALADSAWRPLPDTAAELLRDLGAPPRLGAHLRLVHDVAWSLTDAVGRRWPTLDFDTTAVLFGAATHDIGKVAHVAELSGPGTEHEAEGEKILLSYGVPAAHARFARSHSSWDAPGRDTEDLLVTLADKLWKGERVGGLEDLMIERTGWDLWPILDDLVIGADDRLAFQASFPLSD